MDTTPALLAEYLVQERRLLRRLVEVRSLQQYCRASALDRADAPWRSPGEIPPDATATPSLDARERDLEQTLADVRARLGMVTH